MAVFRRRRLEDWMGDIIERDRREIDADADAHVSSHVSWEK